MCIAIACLVAACTPPPAGRTASQDRAIGSLAVIARLDERSRIEHLGPAPWQRRVTVLDQHDQLNRLATGTLAAVLRAARPGWPLRDVPAADAAAARHGTLRPPELAALAHRLDADALLVLTDATMALLPGRGVGAIARTPPALTRHAPPPASRPVALHCFATLSLVDREGRCLQRQSASLQHTLPATELGLDPALAMLATPAGQACLRAPLQATLRAALLVGAARMGYGRADPD